MTVKVHFNTIVVQTVYVRNVVSVGMFSQPFCNANSDVLFILSKVENQAVQLQTE